MNIMPSRYTKWHDVAVRTDSGGVHYLLQMKRHKKTNKAVFRNIKIDKAWHRVMYILFHGDQNIKEVIERVQS